MIEKKEKKKKKKKEGVWEATRLVCVLEDVLMCDGGDDGSVKKSPKGEKGGADGCIFV